MPQHSKIRIFLNLLAAIFLVAITGEYGDTRISVIETLEKQSYDWRVKRAGTVKRDDIVIVDIDRDTLRKYGNWPLQRDLFAELDKQLFGKYLVRIAAYALPFSERDDTGLRLLDEIDKNLGDKVESGSRAGAFSTQNRIKELLQTLRGEYNYDEKMRRSLENKPVVLGFLFDETGRVQGAMPPPLKVIDSVNNPLSYSYLKSPTRGWPLLRGYAGNLPDYLTAAQNAAGHLNFNLDGDGLVRNAPHFIVHASGIYPSLPLAMYMRLQNKKSIAVNIDDGGAFGKPSITSVSVGNRTLPMNDKNSVFIRYLGAGGRHVDFAGTPEAAFRYFSFVDVVEGRLDVKDLDDKIVLIGSSSEQLRLLYPTPVNPAMPGVEILATQLANLLDENALVRGNSAFLLEAAVLLALSIVLSAIFALLGPLFGIIGLAAAIGGYLYFVLEQWESNNIIWTVVPALVTFCGLFLFNTIVGFIFEWRSNRQLQSTFGQYVPPEFAKKIGTSGSDINLEGEERELSVLFSDVRNFTAVSEQLTPRELTLMMNRMLTDLTEVIHDHGGTVDKYIGDAIMAFWNAPLHDEAHAKNAVLAAIDMQAAMKKISDDFVANGFQEMNLGVGICTGNANVGNMGSTLRMTYTAIGDTVNLASRTEGLTKYYRCPILVTDSTYERCNEDIAFRAVDLVRVKGRQKPALLYQPVGMAHLVQGEQFAILEVFEEMRQLYVQGDFTAAEEKLSVYAAMAADDPLIELYQERLAELKKNPPIDWSGILTHQEK